MYLPAAFSEERLDVLHKFIQEHSFASVVTQSPQGLVASHVPVVLLTQRGRYGALQMHLARQNGQCQALAEGTPTLVMFHGPHAYISPTWYATPVSVPTWNYVAVHAYGQPRRLDDEELTQHLNLMVASYEISGPAGWSTERIPAEAMVKLQKGIAGFEMEITRIEGKWKLGQNRSSEDVRGAVRGLRERADADSLKIADLMSRAADKGMY